MARKANVEHHASIAKKMSMRALVDRLGELRDQRLPIEEEEAALKSEFIARFQADPLHRPMRAGLLYEAEYTEITQWIIDQAEIARKLACTEAALPRKQSLQRKVEARRRAGTIITLAAAVATKQAAG